MRFLHFDYTLANDSPAPVLFSAAEVRISVERVVSMDSWYDSHADVLRGWDTIRVGERRTYQLYTVYTDSLVFGSAPVVAITVPGIR